jgi:AcrR family transcriptional regulator
MTAIAIKHRRSATPELRHRQILEAAKRILVDQSFHEVVLDDVARKAGVAKGTLYLYFKDKEHLYAAVMGSLIDAMEERISGAIDGEKVPMRRLRRTVESMLVFFDENQDFLMQCGQVKPGLCGKKASGILRERFSRHLAFLSSIAQEYTRSGDLRRHDAPLGGQFLIALTRMFMVRKAMTGGAPLKDNAEDLMDLFLNGLGRHEKGAAS